MPSCPPAGTTLRCPEKVPLADFTTWRVGGPAHWLLEPKSVEQIHSRSAVGEDGGAAPFGSSERAPICSSHDSGLPGLTLCLRHMQGAELDQREGVRSCPGG